MKNLLKPIISFVAFLSLTTSCQKLDESIPSSPNRISITKESVNKSAKVALVCKAYSLVLGGLATTNNPHAAGKLSYIYGADLIAGNDVLISTINDAAGNVTTVTGMTHTNVNTELWVTTGQTSNRPRRLLRVNIATGNVLAVVPTTLMGNPVALQDVEYNPVDNRLYAIVEGTNQIVTLTTAGVCTGFVFAPTNFRLNGLTIDPAGNVVVIASQSNFACAANFGDCWIYNPGAVLLGARSYNSAFLATIGTELGLYHDSCVPRTWVVGSNSNNFVQKSDLSCATVPIVFGAINRTYDYARKI